MPPWLIAVLICLVVGLVVALVWRPVRTFAREVNVERARETFKLQRERLEAKFLDLAQASGKPKGLRWADVDFGNEVRFARDRQTGELAAFVPVTIRFEAIAGGGMEHVEAVGNLRAATALFHFHAAAWGTGGRALFNMNPDQVMDHYKDQFEPISASTAE